MHRVRNERGAEDSRPIKYHILRWVEPGAALGARVRGAPRTSGGELGPPRDVVVPGNHLGDGSGRGHIRHTRLSEGGRTSRHGSMGPGRPARLASLMRPECVPASSARARRQSSGAAHNPAGAGRDFGQSAVRSRASTQPAGDSCSDVVWSASGEGPRIRDRAASLNGVHRGRRQTAARSVYLIAYIIPES